MKILGNILWLIFGGLLSSIIFFIQGILCFIFIIFIPVGFQYFKLAKFVLWPFGKKVEKVNLTGFKTFCNILYAIVVGWLNFLLMGLAGVLLCVTIIGIPFGLQYFKMARFVLTPLGYDFEK